MVFLRVVLINDSISSSNDLLVFPSLAASSAPFLFRIRSDEGLTLETSAFRISVRWPIYIINSVDKTKFLYSFSLSSSFRDSKLCSLAILLIFTLEVAGE